MSSREPSAVAPMCCIMEAHMMRSCYGCHMLSVKVGSSTLNALNKSVFSMWIVKFANPPPGSSHLSLAADSTF